MKTAVSRMRMTKKRGGALSSSVISFMNSQHGNRGDRAQRTRSSCNWGSPTGHSSGWRNSETRDATTR